MLSSLAGMDLLFPPSAVPMRSLQSMRYYPSPFTQRVFHCSIVEAGWQRVKNLLLFEKFLNFRDCCVALENNRNLIMLLKSLGDPSLLFSSP
ncbi:hypothetical protein TNIN_60801 [Trichonephila inaurata madagascariensis]|uniref:Uncharacterized protein n=1 Tax=Trichonephila inaurata madagascariensis TaxID=2747483 RepID=A0A8X6XXH0_9ARAC|nr:hypothetical protein TNIN_60801 [Trichonephila inaurata madagascariensis]